MIEAAAVAFFSTLQALSNDPVAIAAILGCFLVGFITVMLSNL